MKKILHGTYIDIETHTRKCLELDELKKSLDCHSDCRWFGKRWQKCSCCKRNLSMKDNYET